METVVKHRLLNIVKERERRKRKAFYDSFSLDKLLEEADIDFIEKFLRADDEGFNSFVKGELPEALSKTIDKLSARQKELCRLLREEGLNVKEASSRMSIPRSTLQEEIKRIREIFRK
jgi:RNA polymerase sigma-70 factor (ECF subfamily)